MLEVISGWHYDRILAWRENEVRQAYADQQQIRANAQVGKKRWEGIVTNKQWSTYRMNEEQARHNLALLTRATTRDFTQGAIKQQKLTKNSHPILLGPATLDSLLNGEPDRLDYIQEGRFPFDNVFFELMDPIEFSLPGYDLPARLCGFQLNKGQEIIGDRELTDDEKAKGVINSGRGYAVSAYFLLDDNSYADVHFGVVSERLLMLQITARLPRSKELLYCDRNKTDLGNGIVTLGDFTCERHRDTPPHQPYRFDDEEIEFGFPMGDINTEKIEQAALDLNRLVINTINYINAQNVTIVPRTRKVVTAFSRAGKRPIEHEAEKQYHVVSIESRLQEIEEERPSTGTTLQWRVYVRGHDRKYRNEDGSIRLTLWIEPHVKGPEGAPWRHHRYAALAGMIQREKEKIANYLPIKIS